MPLMPKRVKYRKSQRGSRKGNASRTINIDFGAYAPARRWSVPGSPTRRLKPLALP
jgi:hypothetical protein